ncbi:cation-translocating P-type ATPase [Paenibacillus sp. LHD-117]|uniref:heavy metal translocating P-type ATPase n=1 Tax=Paenibacillus sp. LHD-117 TaxID=3071412 RepID=UPI0027E1F03F|nr:cation-translocating P-type ATPase [Paenibacillus sp. LHD-117]MDQ6421593.1 cation-translocating P-type ATPase [Paenibacillus sp. LHD-117]
MKRGSAFGQAGRGGAVTELDFTIQGMSCSACAARIERVVGRMDGVREAAVSFPLRTAWVQLEAGAATREEVADKIKQLGFTAMTTESAGQGLRKERKALLIRLIASLIMTLPLLATMLQHIPLLQPLMALLPAWIFLPWLQLFLATVIQFVIGMPFYFGAYYAIRQRSANMDVLVALGTTAAYLYSHYVVFSEGFIHSADWPQHAAPLYFETSAVVMTAVLLGKFIETNASLRTHDESLGFGKLQSGTATVEREGELTELKTEFVREGDVVVVQGGEMIPVDGTVQSGESHVDESLLTGESLGAAKLAGDLVWAGTLNIYGTLRIETKAAGHDTMLNRIADLVKQGQRSKSTIQSQVDAAAGWFVPMMLLIAAGSFLAWGLWLAPGDWGQATVCALAVLLAACPCALGLAAPISLAIASGRLAKRGIIAKEASVLERLAAIRTIVLDKTGTLTEGKPKVSHLQTFSLGQTAFLRIVAALEAESSHPLAEAIREEARRLGMTVTDAEAIVITAGGGVQGRIRGVNYSLGNLRFIERQGFSVGPWASQAAKLREKLGETVLYATQEGECIGIVSFADRLKADAARTVISLRKLGIAPIVATGDHESPARAAAGAIGIRDVHASMLPEGKLTLVESLKRRGGRVAVAGDGWNDAPALAAADVGIAMGSGTEAALAAGHLTLLFSRLPAIPEAVRISRQTIRNIRQNLAFAFLYNAVIIPFAAAGLLEPWMAGTAMALSSVSVVGNALRLNTRLRSVEDGAPR